MLKNKLLVLSLVTASFLAGILCIRFSPSIETFAQRVFKNTVQYENYWKYCAITHINVENPPPNYPDKFVGSVTIDYFARTFNKTTVKDDFVQNECIKHELNYAEFLQETGLKNNAQSQALASRKAADLALAKAMDKLGSGGWEMTGRSFANFNFETLDGGNTEYKQALYFRKHFAQRQTNSQQ